MVAAFGERWNQPSWSVVRGGEGVLSPHARAFRAGVRVSELEAATQAADSQAVSQTTEAIAQLAAPVDAGGPVAARYRELATSGAVDRAARQSTARQLRTLLGAATLFDLGAWTEMARLALAAQRLDLLAPEGAAIAELRRISRLVESASVEEQSIAAPVLRALEPFRSGRKWSREDIGNLLAAVDAAIGAGAQ
jgi:hypothetical protein